MTVEATKTEVGSYFISNYPPFSQWSAESVDEVRTALAAPPADVPLGLYLHIPFCRKRCKFCYFKVFTDKNGDQVERYLAALSREIELVSRVPAMGGRPFRFVYFGGGEPPFFHEYAKEIVEAAGHGSVYRPIDGGNHFYNRHTGEIVEAIYRWLSQYIDRTGLPA